MQAENRAALFLIPLQGERQSLSRVGGGANRGRKAKRE